MTDPRIIWIASIPRAGSMWLFNVTRKLLQVAGREVQPQSVPKFDEQIFELAEQALQDTEPARIYVLKTHARIRSDIRGSAYITCVRDVRDALVSWMRFMRSDFDKALNAAKDMTVTIDYYNNFPRERLLPVAYEAIIADPFRVCTEIADFLSINVTDTVINSIVDMYSKKNVARHIASKELEIMKRIKDNETVPEDDVFPNFDHSLRAYDTETGFQGGHVSGYRDGDWRTILTQDQQDRMQEMLGEWLKHNGYT